MWEICGKYDNCGKARGENKLNWMKLLQQMEFSICPCHHQYFWLLLLSSSLWWIPNVKIKNGSSCPSSKYSLILFLFSLFKSFHGDLYPFLMVLLSSSLWSIVKVKNGKVFAPYQNIVLSYFFFFSLCLNLSTVIFTHFWWSCCHRHCDPSPLSK